MKSIANNRLPFCKGMWRFSVLSAFILALFIFIGLGIDVQAGESSTRMSTVVAPGGVATLFDSDWTVEEYFEAAEKDEGPFFGYTNLGICNTEENNLNIRAIPGENGRLIGKLPKMAACEILHEEDGWTFIVSGKVEGFVKSEYLLTGFPAVRKANELASLVAVVNTEALKVREEPNTDCEVITLVPRGEQLDIDEVLDCGWVKIFLDAEEAYVSGDFVEVKYDLRTAITMSELLYGEGVSDIRVDICQFAKQFLGNRYVYGGTSLTKGADCSGFVYSVFRNFGISLPRSSVSQASAGSKVSMADIKAGDLIFYARGGKIDHVALYIGGGQVIHASSPKTGIKISRYNYRSPHTVRRVIYD